MEIYSGVQQFQRRPHGATIPLRATLHAMMHRVAAPTAAMKFGKRLMKKETTAFKSRFRLYIFRLLGLLQYWSKLFAFRLLRDEVSKQTRKSGVPVGLLVLLAPDDFLQMKKFDVKLLF